MRRLLVALSLSLLAPLGAQAAAYTKIIMCDLGGLPSNRTTTTDVSLFSNFTVTGSTAVVPPSCDFGGLPSNTVTTTDASLFSSAVNSVSYPLPANGFVDFTATAPGSCSVGVPCDVTGTITSVSKETVNAPASGFDNTRGQLQVSVALSNNTAGCSTAATIAPQAPLNNLAGGVASSALTASVTCTSSGSADLTFYVPAGLESVATTTGTGLGEACAGATLCGAGAHLDAITVTINVGSPCNNNGVVEAGEQCDQGAANGTAGSCCSASCTFVAAATTCRAAAGTCDVAETCTGASGACPADGFAANTVTCRASAGACDVAENCSGSSASCPADGFAANTVVCRAAADACDAAENCDGVSASCPVDGFATAGTACTADAFQCTNDQCDGSGTCTHPNKADGTSCTDCPLTAPSCAGCLSGACQNDTVIKLVKISGGPTSTVDVVINTGLSSVTSNQNNLGGYDLEVTFDDTIADFACPSGIAQQAAQFNEPLLNQCVITNPGTASAKIRIADANTMRTATTGAVTVKRLTFTNVTAAQTLSVALTASDPDNLINYDALTVSCGGACPTSGTAIP